MTLLKLQDLEVIWTLKVTLCWYSKTRIDIQSLVPVKHIYINSVWRNIRICPICHTCDKSKLCDVNNSNYRGISMTPIYGADPSNISGRYTHIWGLPRQVKLFCSTDHNVQEPISKPIFYPFYSFMIGRSKQSMKESTYFGLGIQWNWSSSKNGSDLSPNDFDTKNIATLGPSLSSKLIWSSSQLIS